MSKSKISNTSAEDIILTAFITTLVGGLVAGATLLFTVGAIPTHDDAWRLAQRKAGVFKTELMGRDSNGNIPRMYTPAFEFLNYELHTEDETLEDRITLEQLEQYAAEAKDGGYASFIAYNGNSFDREEYFFGVIDGYDVTIYGDEMKEAAKFALPEPEPAKRTAR
jgi:hypothetical protein